MFKSFSDYVEDRKQGANAAGLAGTPKVKLVADYDGPTENSPPKNKSGDGSDYPYKPANGNIDPNKNADKTGFATAGDKKLIYNPDFAGGNSKLTALGKEVPSVWATNGTTSKAAGPPAPTLPKTEHFIKTTKNMSAAEFAHYMTQECGEVENDDLPMVSSLEAGPFHPHPPEAIRYIVALGKKNPKIVEQLVHDAKRSGVLGHLLKSVLAHQEAYDHLSELLSDEEGAHRARFLARALNKLEHVGPPMGLGHEEKDKPNTSSGDQGDDDENADHDFGHPDDDDVEDSDMDHDEDSEEDDEDDDDSDFSGDDDGDNDDDQHGPDDGSGEDEEEGGRPNPMMKKPSARDNLMNAMKAYMASR